MKTIRKILLIFLVIIGLLIITGVLISKLYEEEIGQFAIQELNKSIKTPVYVEEIDLTLLRKFPYASVHLKNLYIPSVRDYDPDDFPERNTDTLLVLQDAFFQFSLKGFFRKRYEVKDVHLNKGKVNIYIDREGKGNFVFWHEQEQSRESRFKLNLQNLRTTQIGLNIYNLTKQTEINGLVKRLNLNGDFQKKEYELSEKFLGHIDKYISDEILYFQDMEIQSQARLLFKDGLFEIINGLIKLDDIVLNVDGTIDNAFQTNVDLVINGEYIQAASLINHFPGKLSDVQRTIKVSGNTSIYTTVKGAWSVSEHPSIESRFRIEQGQLYLTGKDVNLYDIQLEGIYSNGTEKIGSSASLSLEQVSFKYLNSRFGGKYSIRNFKDPEFDYSIKADFYLEHLKPFFTADAFEYLNGNVKTQINIKGKHDKLFEFKKQDLLNWKFNGTFLLEGVQFKLAGKRIAYENISGTFNFNKYLKINNLHASIADNNLIISGRVDNIIERIVHDQTSIWADLEIYSDGIILDSLLAKNQPASQMADSGTNVFPEHLYVKSRYWLDRFSFRNFTADHVRGELVYRPGSLILNSFQFSSMGGHVSGDGFIEEVEAPGFQLRLRSNVHRINISDLFSSCDNFGQTFIQDHHLKGTLTGTVDFYSQFDESQKILKETILSESDVEINHGELIQFEPMLGLSKFIEVEELKHISFSTLSNQVFIRNSEVVIPQMDIQSSALNISGSGIHQFSNCFDYKVVVELSELLSKKSQNANSNQQEFGIIEDDGLGRTKLYLSIRGTPEDYDISYDRKSAIQSVKDRMKDEKKELKTILNEEFGLFKNDTIEEKSENESGRPDFIIAWDEEEEIDDSLSMNKNEGPAFIIEWEDGEEDTATEVKTKRRKNRNR